MKLEYAQPLEAGMNAERLQLLRKIGMDSVSSGMHSTLVMLAARRGQIVFHEAFGKIGPEADAPAAPLDTIFPINSLSKPVTAALAMNLVEQGRLGLYRPVREYLPEFQGEGKDFVMVSNLLTHTSGLSDGDESAEITPEQIRELIENGPPLNPPLSYEPMSIMEYANINFNLMGVIVERVAGMSLADFARETLFEPLGMDDTSYTLPEMRQDKLAWRPADDMWSLAMPILQAGLGAGSVFSTAYDMAVFTQMFLNGGTYGGVRILSPGSVRAMTTDQIPGLAARLPMGIILPVAGWGLGWNIHAGKKIKGLAEAIQSYSSYGMNGAGFVAVWCDPLAELIGAFFAVNTSKTPDIFGNMDLFVNVVTGAIS